jgi:hypothetical protein
LRQIDLTHSTRSEFRDYLVLSKARAGIYRHFFNSAIQLRITRSKQSNLCPENKRQTTFDSHPSSRQLVHPLDGRHVLNHPIAIRRNFSRENLQRDLAIELRSCGRYTSPVHISVFVSKVTIQCNVVENG